MTAMLSHCAAPWPLVRKSSLDASASAEASESQKLQRSHKHRPSTVVHNSALSESFFDQLLIFFLFLFFPSLCTKLLSLPTHVT